MRIVTSLLHANYKENLITINKQNRFCRPVYIYSCCQDNGTYVSLTIKKKQQFVLSPCLLPFLATEESKVLEKKENETQVSKTVFSHPFGAAHTDKHVAHRWEYPPPPRANWPYIQVVKHLDASTGKCQFAHEGSRGSCCQRVTWFKWINRS